MKTGVLLINLGTPAAANKKAVRRYLKEFLDDPRVIDLPWWIRKPLLHLFILPFRPKQSAKAYAAIWDEETGSPLLFHTQQLGEKLQAQLPAHYQVEIGMRYGEPSIASALNKLFQAQCQKIILLPLFPQYSSAATGSAIAKCLQVLQARQKIPAIKIIPSFYQDSHYITAKVATIAPWLERTQPDCVLFSYHSLPQRHLTHSQNPCLVPCAQNQSCPQDIQHCYRAQCYDTSRLLAEKLNLNASHYEVVFQSRLGRTVWVGPEIQQVMAQLRQRGVNNLLVVCPSFVADCLETLEEIGIRAKEHWQTLGGKHFNLVPCLNTEPSWVNNLAQFILSA